MLARQREGEARGFEKVQKQEEARRKGDATRWRKEKDELRTVTKEDSEERMPRPAQEKPSAYPVNATSCPCGRLHCPTRSHQSRCGQSLCRVESAPQNKNLLNAPVRAQTNWQGEKARVERRRKQLEEQHRLKEQRYLEGKGGEEKNQREREDQVRLDEELSRQELARLDREDLAEREREQEEQILLDEELSRREQDRLNREPFVGQEWKPEEQIRLDEELSREEKVS